MRGNDDTILVVGGGGAAHACVTTYREAGGERPVVMVSNDDRLPYFRPAVSKELLRDETDGAAMALAPASWYADHEVDVMLDCCVDELDASARVASTTTAGPVRWGRCVLATGSIAAPLPADGADAVGVIGVRRALDTEGLLAADLAAVLVIGSGFVGCEVAAGLRERGSEVTMVSLEQRPQQDRLGPDVAALVEGWLRDVGVVTIGGRSAARVERHGDLLAVSLDDGHRLEATCVVSAVGARPELQLAHDLDLVHDGGVRVDTTMRTEHADVLAIGDIATAFHSSAGRHLRVEHWGDAVAHGRIAGQTLAGVPAAWTEPPGFWSTIAGRTIKHVAWGDGYDEIRVRRSSDGLTAWYGRNGVVVGVLTSDHDDDAAVAAIAIAERWAMPLTS